MLRPLSLLSLSKLHVYGFERKFLNLVQGYLYGLYDTCLRTEANGRSS